MNAAELEAEARRELAEEAHRDAVNAAKNRIVEKAAAARWWHGLVPFKITIQRRDHV